MILQLSAGPPAPRCPRYASLDIWRGVACLAVVVFHATLYAEPAESPTGLDRVAAVVMGACGKLWLGVPVFFVISGYCIAASADSSRRRSEPLAIYFMRRFRRIYPPFWTLLFSTFGVVAICEGGIWPGLFADRNHPIAAPTELSAWQWIGNFTLTETWRHNLVGEGKGLFLGHAWTLCYEEQFYLVCGLILLVAPQHFFRAAGLVTFAVFPLALLAYKLNCRGFFFDGFWVTFSSGIFVYFHANYATRRERRTIELLLATGMVACWIDPLHHWKFASIEQHGFVSFAFALALIALRRWDAAVAAAAITAPLRSCGLISYSLYLIHWPITKAISHLLFDAGFKSHIATLAVTIPACVGASILAAWPFHLLVERRFLNSHSTSTPEQARPAAEQSPEIDRRRAA